MIIDSFFWLEMVKKYFFIMILSKNLGCFAQALPTPECQAQVSIDASSDQLNNLLFFGLEESMRYHAPSLIAFKSDGKMAGYNRAIITKDTSHRALQALRDFYAGTPYAFWIDEADKKAKSKVIQRGFSCYGPFHAMKLDIGKLRHAPLDNKIVVRPVANDNELFATWIPIAIQSYTPQLQGDAQKNYMEQFAAFITYLQKSHAPSDIIFYLGFWDGIPVATGMFIRSPGFVGIHRIGTLPKFRRRGIGHAITSLPLHEFKKQGIEQALLLASPHGYSLYEKMGFEKLLTYEVYTKQ